MAEKRLTFRIDARDDASAVLGKIGSAAQREMGKAEDALDDTRTAGQRLADELGKVNDEVVRELGGIEQAAEKLAQALGPELAAKLGDAKIDRAIQDFRRLGLTFEEIEVDAEALAAQIKRADEIAERAGHSGRQAFDGMSDSVRRVGSDSDQSLSVLANASGNAAQDVGELAGVSGTAGIAIGQLAEYATEGGISLANLAKVAGPMALLTVATIGVKGALEKAAKAAQLHEEQTEGLRKELVDGGTAADYFRRQLEDTGRIEFVMPTGGIEDASAAIAAAGLTVEQYGQLVEGGEPAIMAWVEAQRAAGNESDAVGVAALAALDAVDSYTTGAAAAETTTRLLGRSEEWLAEQLATVNAKLEENRRRNDEARQAALDHVNALDDARRAALNLADAEDATRDAIQEATTATDDATTASDEVAAAWRRAEQAAYDQADAAVGAAQQAYGGALTAQQAAQIQIESLTGVANTLAPGSPLRVNLERYIQELQNVPRTVTTTFNANYAASVNSPASIYGGPRAAGGPIDAGKFYKVTEGGRSELLHEGGDTYLMAGSDGFVEPLPQAGGASRGGGGGGGGGIVINVAAGFGADGDDIANKIVDALVKWQRRNGQLPWAA